MKLLTIAMWLCTSATTAALAVPATAPCAACVVRAPAPLIGTGIPTVLVLGAVLLSASLLAHWRRS